MLTLFLAGLFLVRTGGLTPQTETANLPKYPTRIVKIGGENFTILQTRTQVERELGLGAVKNLPRHYGMLFVADDQLGIWMKGMKYPIDILWIDHDNRLIHIVHDADPSGYPKTTYVNPPHTRARYVIEINAGEAKRLGLTLGDKIVLQQL